MSSLIKCYAAPLGNCSTRVSREHYISRGILEVIGQKITVSGFAWLKGKTKELYINGMTSKILWEKHNSQLSTLDGVGINLFKTIKRFDKELGRQFPSNELIEFSGYDVERWFIKFYLGMHRGGQLQETIEGNVEDYLLEALFLGKKLPGDYGLYFGLPLGSKVSIFTGISAKTFLCQQKKDIVAVECQFMGIPFVLSLRPAIPGGTGKISTPCQHHPIGIDLDNSNHTVKKSISFIW